MLMPLQDSTVDIDRCFARPPQEDQVPTLVRPKPSLALRHGRSGGGAFVSAAELIAAALALGAREVTGWSPAEAMLSRSASKVPAGRLAELRRAIDAGEDPLGDAFCRLRSPAQRRTQGATYTPAAVVAAMLDMAEANQPPERIVDPGTGSGRFVVAAGRRFPKARLLGIELDPLAALVARAHLAAAGMAERSEVCVADFCRTPLPDARRTLFLGNPPYVRHHDLTAEAKHWLSTTALSLGLRASRLAGLHLHFLLAIASQAAPGDRGVLIMADQWLDVNYGRLARELLLGPLGVHSIKIIEPTVAAFADAQTTAAIVRFEVGTVPTHVELARVAQLDELASPIASVRLPREQLAAASRWSPLSRPAVRRPAGFVELGEVCRVSRGQATGANQVWIEGAGGVDLPARFLFPCVTRARELFALSGALDDSSTLRRVVDLPGELDLLDKVEREQVERFLRTARAAGVAEGYLARHRKAWWSVGLLPPAPLLATYMARRPPAFVRNRVAARNLNIAHGIYPRQPLSEAALEALRIALTQAGSQHVGRIYAGGLTKFEPREMQRLLVPRPE